MSGDMAIHDDNAERLVIGSVLLAPRILLELEGLSVEHFYVPEHQSVWQAITQLDHAREPLEPVTVWNKIQANKDNRGRLDAAYLFSCVEMVATPVSAPVHARSVRDMAARRAAAEFATRIAAHSTNLGTDVHALMDTVAVQSQQLVDSITVGTSVPTMADLLQDAVAYVEELANGDVDTHVLRTGFVDLDEMLNGLRPGQLVCVAARPGAGKTSLALDMLRHNALRDKRKVLMFSLEMSSRELVLRLLAAETNIPLGKILSGQLSDADWAQIAHSYGQLSEAPITIIDDATVSMMDAHRLTRVVAREQGVELVIIDYLQLMRSGAVTRSDNRQQEVADISRNAKILAKEMQVPVIALSQLNRAVEARPDKKPTLSDLRDSGAIEQDSDVVLMIHREEMYVPETPRVGEADILIAKNRAGRAGVSCVLTWVGSSSHFANAAHVQGFASSAASVA